MSILLRTAAEIQASLADSGNRLRQLAIRQEALQGGLEEISFPTVPYDDPAWFISPEEFATWELGPWGSGSLIPPDLAELMEVEEAAFWPGEAS